MSHVFEKLGSNSSNVIFHVISNRTVRCSYNAIKALKILYSVMYINFLYFGDDHTEFCLVSLIGFGCLRHSHVTQVDLKFAM